MKDYPAPEVVAYVPQNSTGERTLQWLLGAGVQFLAVPVKTERAKTPIDECIERLEKEES